MFRFAPFKTALNVFYNSWSRSGHFAYRKRNKTRHGMSVARSQDRPPLLLTINPGTGCVEKYFSNHPVLEAVSGHFEDGDLELFYTDDVHKRVVDLIGNGPTNDCMIVGYDLDPYGIDPTRISSATIARNKRKSLAALFWSEGAGSIGPGTTMECRGTIVVTGDF